MLSHDERFQVLAARWLIGGLLERYVRARQQRYFTACREGWSGQLLRYWETDDPDMTLNYALLRSACQKLQGEVRAYHIHRVRQETDRREPLR